jgi:hypothetical protein
MIVCSQKDSSMQKLIEKNDTYSRDERKEENTLIRAEHSLRHMTAPELSQQGSISTDETTNKSSCWTKVLPPIFKA